MRSSRTPSPIITLLTDFGLEDAYVGLMKGVILEIDPAARIVDLTHCVPPQDITRAALILRSAVEYFPPGTIHVAVVDPGVGSSRRPLLVHTPRAAFVGPDNGVLVPAARQTGELRAYVLDQPSRFRQPVSQTFHGRDVFAPVAAHLSVGADPATLGTPTPHITELSLPRPRIAEGGVEGEVIYIDRFGNLVTNIEASMLDRFRRRSLSVSIGGTPVAGPVASYAAVAEGTPLALIDSWNVLEIAVRNGSAARELRAGLGTTVRVTARDQDNE